VKGEIQAITSLLTQLQELGTGGLGPPRRFGPPFRAADPISLGGWNRFGRNPAWLGRSGDEHCCADTFSFPPKSHPRANRLRFGPNARWATFSINSLPVLSHACQTLVLFHAFGARCYLVRAGESS